METVTDDIEELIRVLPKPIAEKLSEHTDIHQLYEVVLDLGKPAEARFSKKSLLFEDYLVQDKDLDFVASQVGEFTTDNRAGIERTLHRISCIRNRRGKIIGLTCRVGRAIYGTIDIARDVIETGKSILFLGRPGIGKTTKLREAARVLADDFGKRVVIIDTSNEIGGDGDIPHPAIGKARRMQVSEPSKQHAVMIEAVENHMPEVIIVDEIGTEAEAQAARTIAERGVQLIGTAHGTELENVLKNPTLSDLLGGIQTVILGDEEAKRRHTQKAVLERKAPPTFDAVIELQERDRIAVYHDAAKGVDAFLRGNPNQPEIRVRTPQGNIEVSKKEEEFPAMLEEEAFLPRQGDKKSSTKIYTFAVNRGKIERSLHSLNIPAKIVSSMEGADFILTVRSRAKPGSRIVQAAEERHIPIHVLRSNTSTQIQRFLRHHFDVQEDDEEETALHEAEEAVQQVIQNNRSIELGPQNAYIRRLQHQLVNQYHLETESFGEEPFRRLRIYPRG